ncbi:tail fiber protein [Acidovorax sp. LjRoot118]|uniref:phage tail protein n=1 Tax=unclassified Acidovorax TaxID=2684926 RepID=UPI003D01F46E
MAQPFMGEIRLCSFNFAPKGWAMCNGQILPINQNQALFSLLGTTYGGDGVTTFALPNLRGRRPIQEGAGYAQGEAGGTEFHTLLSPEMPQHSHSVNVSTAVGDQASPSSGFIAASNVDAPFTAPADAVISTNVSTVTPAGGSQPHENRPPFLVMNFVIALQGIFPSRN